MKTCILMNNNSYVGREYLCQMHLQGLTCDVICLGDFPTEDKVEDERCGLLWRPSPQEELEKIFRFFFFPSLKSPEFLAHLQVASYDLGIQGGTGIIRNEIIEKFKIGILNFHPGHLPEYRGCSAPEWQLFEGKSVYSTCHLIDKDIDTGPIYKIKELQPDLTDYYHFRSTIYPQTAIFVCEVLETLTLEKPRFYDQDESKAVYRSYIGQDKIEILKKKMFSSNKTLSMRRAQLEDCKDIHAIRNEENIRRSSFDSSEIPLNSHQEWFGNCLRDPNRRLYVVTEKDIVLGVVRFDLDLLNASAEVSIYISEKAQGKGAGKFALLEGERLFRNEIPGCPVVKAKALVSNERSVRFFKDCGYTPTFIELIKT